VVGQLLSLLTFSSTLPGVQRLSGSTALASKIQSPALVLLQHALGRLDGRNDDYRHSADQSGKK
jgi:hypothetical protein